jgi:diacylglycerol kinase
MMEKLYKLGLSVAALVLLIACMFKFNVDVLIFAMLCMMYVEILNRK